MRAQRYRVKIPRLVVSAIAIVAALVMVVPPTLANHLPPLARQNFTTAVGPGGDKPQGFGDRDNSWAWSMAWFQGKLYVGTSRASRCVEAQIWHRAAPTIAPVPVPNDADCPATLPELLPRLQAEIWRYTPGPPEVWERVLQSPFSIDNPETGQANAVPADIGFRGMYVFKEQDGTEALYVGGLSAKPMFGLQLWGNRPSQRLLRTTNGTDYTQVNSDPNTVLGNPVGACFRGMTSFQGKFYVLACNIQGSGQLYASAHPEAGGGTFTKVTPDSVEVFEYAPYQGRLFVGTHDFNLGYSVMFAQPAPSDPGPYTFTTLIPKGAYLTERPNTDVLSMYEFRGRLYVGGNGVAQTTAAELIRINPDLTWDVVAGKKRTVTTGTTTEVKTPISGFPAGFSNHFNQHMWRMGAHDDALHVGTFDSSTTWRYYDGAKPYIGPLQGYDLWQTREGWYFSAITTNGFGDPESFGARTFASDPTSGLFVGSANNLEGLTIVQGVPSAAAIGAPQRLEVERKDATTTVLSWLPVNGATKYHVLRLKLREIDMPSFPYPICSPSSCPAAPARPLEIGPSGGTLTNITEEVASTLREAVRGAASATTIIKVVVPSETFGATPIGSPTAPVYVDNTASLAAPYVGFQYVVVAVNANGNISAASNVANTPSETPPMTATVLDAYTHGLEARNVQGAASLRTFVTNVTSKVDGGDIQGAIDLTNQFRQQLGGLFPGRWWNAEDLALMTEKLVRRLYLARANVIPPSSVR